MAKIYNDFASANLMSFAKSFARLNGQPLDKSEIWYSLAEAQAYAATDAAYVGQTLAVIDSANKNVVFYGIQDAEGTLKEVGSAPVGDNLSIEIVDGKVQLKNFGKEYYAYVPAVKDDEGNITEESKYVLTEGFKAGLEPRVIVDGENLVIAWYEPGNETIEDVSANVESVSKVVDELDEALNAEGGLVDQVDELKDQVGTAADDMGNEATGLYKEIEELGKVVDTKADAADVEDLADVVDTKANAADVYTKEAANEAIANAVASAINGADHLRRIVVNSVADIDVEAEDALKFIYMVPTGLEMDDDKYDEYIVIEYAGVDEETGEEVLIRQVERVGSWEVDLSGYAKNDDLNDLAQTVVDNKAAVEEVIADLEQEIADNKAAVEQAIADEAARAAAAEAANATEIAKKADKATTLAGYGIADAYTKEETLNKITEKITEVNGGESAGEVLSQLNSYKETNNARVDAIEEALEALEGAEPNFITAVNEDEFTVTEGTLSLNDIPIAKVTNLQDALGVIQSDVLSLDEILNGKTLDDGQVVQGVVAQLNDLTTTVSNLSDSLVNYVTVKDFNAVVGDLEQMKANNINVMEDIDTIKDILLWKEMTISE